jgi:hypothetical protein
MSRTLEHSTEEANRHGTAVAIDRMEYPRPCDANEAWPVPLARETFARIQAKGSGIVPPKWHRKPRRGEPGYRRH